MDEAASRIAGQVGNALAGVERPRVLVVEDRALLADDWTRAEVQQTLRDLDERLAGLTEFLGATVDGLRRDIAACRGVDEAAAQREWLQRAGLERLEQEDRSRAAAPETSGAERAAGEPVGRGAGALAAATDLMGLLRTDYTVTASAVAPSTPELATLTAAHLAARSSPHCRVEVDGFTPLSPASRTLAHFGDVRSSRDRAGACLAELERTLAPLASEVAALRGRVDHVEQTWKAVVTSDKPDVAARAESVGAEVDRRNDRLIAGERALAPAVAAVTHARDVLRDVDLVLAGLLERPEHGRPKLLVAATRERLHPPSDQDGADDRYTHVLHVQADAVGGDSVTRRSVLGTSGRLGFLGSANASWLLLATDGGQIVGGGQASTGRWMNYDLASGSATSDTLSEGLGALPRDPALALEAAAKVLVVGLVLFLFVVGVLGVVNLALSI